MERISNSTPSETVLSKINAIAESTGKAKIHYGITSEGFVSKVNAIAGDLNDGSEISSASTPSSLLASLNANIDAVTVDDARELNITSDASLAVAFESDGSSTEVTITTTPAVKAVSPSTAIFDAILGGVAVHSSTVTNGSGTVIVTFDGLLPEGANSIVIPGQELCLVSDETVLIDDITLPVTISYPAVTETSVPADEAAGVALDANVVLTYSNELEEAPTVVFTDASEAAVANAVSIDVTNKIVTINPDSNLTLNTEYTVVVSATDVFGQELISTITFTTVTE